MSDISMCLNKECPKKNDCYRFRAIPHPTYQSYADFKYDSINGCEAFWPLEQGMRLKNIKENEKARLKNNPFLNEIPECYIKEDEYDN